MIVHLVGSLRQVDVDAKYLRQIIEVIHNQGGVLARNWLEHDLVRHKGETHATDWTPYVVANLEAVKRADIVIVELTHYAFTQGFLVAAALEHKKPILAVSRESLDGRLASGITNTLFTYKKYSSKEELARLTKTFIERNTVHTKDLRFNMFFTRPIFKYLDDKAHETGKNKSELVRDIIKHKAQRGDRT